MLIEAILFMLMEAILFLNKYQLNRNITVQNLIDNEQKTPANSGYT